MTVVKRQSIGIQTRSPVVMSALVVSRLDYGNATLTLVRPRLFQRLQSVVNTAAWLLVVQVRLSHSAPLPSTMVEPSKRIQFKLAVLV